MANVLFSPVSWLNQILSVTLGLRKLSLKRTNVVIGVAGWLLALRAGAAACCGGAAQVPSLITAEDQRQWTTTISRQDVYGSVDDSGYWYSRSNHIYEQILRMDYAQVVSERWQLGLGLPIQENNDQSSNGSPSLLADSSLTAGYRMVDESFSGIWHPQILLFTTMTLPTGRSFYESQEPLKLDVTGRGFYQPGVGMIFMRTVGDVDAQLSFEAHHGLARGFTNPAASGNLTYTPGFGGSVNLGSGYNRGRWRWGANINQFYEDPIHVSGQNSTSMERVTTGSLTVSYLFPDLLTGTLTYSNQDWFGSPLSTTLGQTLSLAIQKRWPRD